MKKTKIRLIAMALCILMCTSLLPATALAYTAEDARGILLSARSNGTPVITYQPKNRSVKQGETVTFQVKASGKNLKYQWYYRKNANSQWQKYSGKTEPVLTFSAGRRDGFQYACKVSSGSKSVMSRAATLKVNYVKYRALLIGEVNFGWDTAVRNKGDVVRMEKMLSKIKTPMGGSYEITSKYDLSNTGIKNAIRSAFSGADSNDVSLFFIASHGYSDVSDGAYAGAICTVSGKDDLKMRTLAKWLKDVPGKVIVIIGSCGSGAAIGYNGLFGAKAAANASAQDAAFCSSVISAFASCNEYLPSASGISPNVGDFCSSKFYVLTAAMHMESSWGWETGHAGSSYNYFPKWLVKGALGPADANGNRKITLNELYNYVYKKALGPYYDGYDYYYQHARVYPANSSYILFKTP